MKLVILGSCGGYPEPGRACSGFLVRSRTTNIWIDCGTGTLDALLRIIELEALDAILISHLHADHWTDLPIALHRMAVTNAGQTLSAVPVYGPPEWAERTGIAHQWFSRDEAPYVSHTLADGESYTIGDLDIMVAAVQHGMPTFAMRITDGVSTMAYSADTSRCDSLATLTKDADLFLCEATLPDRNTTPISMNPEQAGQMAAIAHARQLVLTHLLPGIDPDESCAIAAEAFSGQVAWAEPGRVFEVGTEGSAAYSPASPEGDTPRGR